MLEQELKLHVPKSARANVERELARGTLTRTRLRALYFDTPSRALARAKISLRLRLEGRRWVQTLKMPGQDSLSRIELNQSRPGPVLDLGVYADLPAGQVLSSLKTRRSISATRPTWCACREYCATDKAESRLRMTTA